MPTSAATRDNVFRPRPTLEIRVKGPQCSRVRQTDLEICTKRYFLHMKLRETAGTWFRSNNHRQLEEDFSRSSTLIYGESRFFATAWKGLIPEKMCYAFLGITMPERCSPS